MVYILVYRSLCVWILYIDRYKDIYIYKEREGERDRNTWIYMIFTYLQNWRIWTPRFALSHVQIDVHICMVCIQPQTLKCCSSASLVPWRMMS